MPDELCEAGAKLKPHKTPGLDLISNEFWQAFLSDGNTAWAATAMFNSFLNNPQLIPAIWCLGKLTLIPKNTKPTDPTHLRPITLQCTGMKLFQRILWNRLLPSLPVPQCQLGCIQGRQAMEGLWALNELWVHAADEATNPCIIKVDVKTAFDSLTHSAIKGFLTRFCQETNPAETQALLYLIQHTYLLLDGPDGAHVFHQQCGIPQGGSISAELFSRILDHTLQSLFDTWRQRREQSCLPQGPYQRKYAILYADDMLLCFQNQAQADRLWPEFQDALASIGLAVNFHKTSIILTPWARKHNYKSTLAQAPQSTFTKYLGLTLGPAFPPSDTVHILLTRTARAWWANRKQLVHPQVDMAARYARFKAIVESTWAWASPAIRLLKNVLHILDTAQTTVVMQMLHLHCQGNWPEGYIHMRRQAKAWLIMHGHKLWSQLLLERTVQWGGHVARMQAWSSGDTEVSPALHIRHWPVTLMRPYRGRPMLGLCEVLNLFVHPATH